MTRAATVTRRDGVRGAAAAEVPEAASSPFIFATRDGIIDVAVRAAETAFHQRRPARHAH